MRPAIRRVSLEVGGVEPPSPGAYRELLQVYPAYRFVEEGAANRRAFPPVSRLVSPSPFGPGPGRASVGFRPRGRSRRRNRGPVVYATYAARAKLPLSLAIKVLPNQEIGGSTCNPRSGPLGSKPVHPLAGRPEWIARSKYSPAQAWGQGQRRRTLRPPSYIVSKKGMQARAMPASKVRLTARTSSRRLAARLASGLERTGLSRYQVPKSAARSWR